MCAVLGLSASGYYAWRARPQCARAAANRALLDDIRRIHADSSGPKARPVCTGAARPRPPCRALQDRAADGRAGIRGLAALPRRTRTTDSRHGHPIAPNWLGRNLPTGAPNQVWLADLTYIPAGESWLYLATVLDPTRRMAGSPGKPCG